MACMVKPHVHTHLSRTFGHVLAFTAAFIWSFNFIGIKMAREEIGPFALAMIRFDIGAAVALVILLIRRPNLRAIRPVSWLLIAGVSVLAGPGFHVLLNIGATGTDTGLIAILISTQSLHVAWAGALFLGERVTKKQMAALLIAFVGLAVPLLVGQGVGFESIGFPIMILTGAVLASTNIILPRVLVAHVNTVDLACLIVIVGAAMCQPLLVFEGLGQLHGLSTTGWLVVGYLGSIGIVGVFLIWYAALRRLPAVTTGFYLFVMMVCSVIWGALLRDEPFSWTYIVAALAVLVGIYLNATAGAIHRKPMMAD
jgi:drug/metabolite transporter (DMT)-like permease